MALASQMEATRPVCWVKAIPPRAVRNTAAVTQKAGPTRDGRFSTGSDMRSPVRGTPDEKVDGHAFGPRQHIEDENINIFV